ncbi:uncharacterized protein B0P05DRAFT_538375 [Gilbertella persicaria]|uniref:Uncharacterized protein n=1 Tax=Rhizopus stolonifer TaxID=4846 RepID=A0A367K000_RHIST|nr:uncharacterized protein B0P05DRAFT_538375 [Gilbertella persicaria]KAI8081866.1 hypothetical protein B0P05DRAFT_538375 [Gilbertella persicaria]RCH95469.1 hypothetical protein CU098_010450 [Rhizopus stolonifer]
MRSVSLLLLAVLAPLALTAPVHEVDSVSATSQTLVHEAGTMALDAFHDRTQASIQKRITSDQEEALEDAAEEGPQAGKQVPGQTKQAATGKPHPKQTAPLGGHLAGLDTVTGVAGGLTGQGSPLADGITAGLGGKETNGLTGATDTITSTAGGLTDAATGKTSSLLGSEGSDGLTNGLTDKATGLVGGQGGVSGGGLPF